MLHWISIVGGLLIMMGHHARSEALFYYFRLEDQIPENHLLRLIDQHVSFEFVRQQLRDSYSETGRPSIDPELLLRMLLIGYLYGITSERKLVEELRMHLAWRWFTGLGFDQEIPHHSTFSKNRHGRFQESKLFEQLFEQIVRQCVEVGLVQGQHLSVDGSFVEANAAKESRIPREQLVEAAQVHHSVRQYLQEVEEQNPVEEPVHKQEQVSTTDPDSTYATKGGTPARLGYYDNYLVDNESCVIVGVQATAARMSQETVAAHAQNPQGRANRRRKLVRTPANVNYAATASDMVDSARMLSFDDERWTHLKGGYKTPFDPRPSLRKLESQQDTASAWQELWEDLHHQGDVGDASYAAIPELVRIHRKGSAADWNLYAMVAIIELARTESRNPEVPEWLRDDYFRSIQELAQMGTKDILSADESETKRAILSVIAIAKGLRTHGKFLVAYSEDELSEMEP